MWFWEWKGQYNGVDVAIVFSTILISFLYNVCWSNKSCKDGSTFLSNMNGYKRNASGTCAVTSISNISGVASTNIRSFGVFACSIYVTRVISFTLVDICKIIKIIITINNWKKLPSISLETLVFFCCGSRRKCFTLQLTKCFSSVPPSSILLFCPVSLNPSIPPFPVEIFYFWSLFNSFTPMSGKTEFLLTKSKQYQTEKWW